MSELSQRITVARNVIREQIAFFQKNFSKVESHWKKDNSRVTEADLSLSRAITEAILKAFPNDDFCSEEALPSSGTVRYFNAEFAWVLDPIDGTNNFARGIPLCAISLALLRDGTPVYGIIYDYAQNCVLEGGESVPLAKDGTPVALPPELPYNEHSLISLHFPLKQHELLELTPITSVNALRCQGSAALNLAYNAFGAIDGSIDHFTRVWDIAAAYAMLIAAGRKIVFIKNKPFPLRQISSEMPKLRWFAGTRSFISRCEQLGLI